MKPFLVEQTEITPKVVFDPAQNTFLVQGKSLPEDVKDFYAPLLKWVDEYIAQPNSNTHIVFDFEYFNTASSKMILILLSKFREMHRSGFPVSVTWKYPQMDAEMEEAGEEFADILAIPFEMIPKPPR
ncbi:MAG: DUF1987 domain-containing protein [Tenuifilaceae bacterium]|jgi:hypothetical protein|nr:DUF1987 domain-containing protein [Tenuifilaceae bacterium]